MYAKVKKSLPEMYALTVCMWLKSNASPGVGTPFSYAVPGQANELVLIEWGNNPMEILINDKVWFKHGLLFDITVQVEHLGSKGFTFHVFEFPYRLQSSHF